MKCVFLNIWHANSKDNLTDFITSQKNSTDVFCFMEADPETRIYLRELLPGFTEHAAVKEKEKVERGPIDIAVYVRDAISVTSVTPLLRDEPMTGLALMVTVEKDETPCAIVAVHGLSFHGDTKLDTPGRLVQSQTIIDTLATLPVPAIVGGDFNLLPEAKSIGLFADTGYKDLIASNKIRTTRNRLAWERFPDSIQYYADFAFVSPSIDVTHFSVPENEASDHLPLILEVAFANKVPDASEALARSLSPTPS